MKLTLNEIVEMNIALREISEKEFPINISVLISDNIQKLSEKAKIFESNRIKLIEKYGEKDKDGNIVENNGQVKITDQKKFIEEFNELSNTEIGIDLNMLDISGLKLDVKPITIMKIRKIIKLN